MEKITSFFTKSNISWKRIIFMSLLLGVIPGLLMVPECLDGTSFQQPGVTFEFWVCAAMFIILNSEKLLEAGLKTFVFFLISQPLIYLVQVPFSWLHWQIFSYYPRWALMTVLTFPGAMIAWYTKKNTWLSVLIWCVAASVLCICLAPCERIVFMSFPRFLIATLFIVAELVIFPKILFVSQKMRRVAYLWSILFNAACLVYELRAYNASLAFM